MKRRQRKVNKLEIDHIEYQYQFVNEHVKGWYEYFENFFKTWKELIHLKNIEGEMTKGEEFDNDSSVSIDMFRQSREFLTMFFNSSLPVIWTLQINNFQKLDRAEISSLFTKVVPEGLKQLILCNNAANKVTFSPKNFDELCFMVKTKLTSALTIQSFKLKDWEFNRLIECWNHLELISINNWSIIPSEKTQTVEDIKLDISSLKTAPNLK